MDSTAVKLPNPFGYPLSPHIRRHGPLGYPEYRYYRNWLRDEFSFRCIYCLRRETWLCLKSDHEIDHYLPKCDHPDVENDYDNLVYACARCNRTKASRYVLSPEVIAYGECVQVDQNGEIHPRNNDENGKTLIEALGLDAPDYTAMRRRILETIAEAPLGGKTLEWCLGYPASLPNLNTERKPKRNTREKGIQNSFYEKKDKLPSYY